MDKLFKVPYTTILNVENHPNADRLEICTVYGFKVITQKDKYKIGDTVVYIPIDSIIPPDLETILFPPDSKIKLHKSRVKQIKIRGIYSQGMIVDSNNLTYKFHHGLDESLLEQDLSNELNITKYEPPLPRFQQIKQPKLRNKPKDHPDFRKYNGIQNIKWEPNKFIGQEVVIQEKLHGTSTKFGKLPYHANTLFKKFKKLFGLTPKYQNVYGSNNVDITNSSQYTGYYGEDIYGQCLNKLKVFDKILPNEIVYGEIIGHGIQKGYDYGHKEHHLVIFDVRKLNSDGTQTWLNPEEAEAYAKERGFDFVPTLYKGVCSQEVIDLCTKGASVYYPKEAIREGCVIKLRYEYDKDQNKQALKSINPDYLNTDPTDNH